MEYTFTWLIENYSYCLQENTQALVSPEFFASELEKTAWCIHLYPRGRFSVDENSISFHVKRSKVDGGPEKISLNYELSLLGEDGSAVISKEFQSTFGKGDSRGCLCFLRIQKLFSQLKATLLPEDILSVRCKMWIHEGQIHKIGQSIARTRNRVEHVSFIHVIEDFRTLKTDKKVYQFVYFNFVNDRHLKSSFQLAESECCDWRINFEITQHQLPYAVQKVNQILSKWDLLLLGSSGIVMKWREDNCTDVERKDISKVSLSLPRKYLLDNGEECLPDGKLTFLCQCSFSSGVEYEKIERTLREIPSSVLNLINKNLMTEAQSVCPTIVHDLKALHSTQLLADVELKTETESYPAHKNLLCARSPVFKAMFTNDMKEKNTKCINMDDFENDTVDNLLQFLYSDSLGNLEWDSALYLYDAADKYFIEKLKFMCSSILLDRLVPSKAAKLLFLADTHGDSDLQRAVEDFILTHEEQVYGSDDWLELAELMPSLVGKTMLLKYKRKYLTPSEESEI